MIYDEALRVAVIHFITNKLKNCLLSAFLFILADIINIHLFPNSKKFLEKYFQKILLIFFGILRGSFLNIVFGSFIHTFAECF